MHPAAPARLETVVKMGALFSDDDGGLRIGCRFNQLFGDPKDIPEAADAAAIWLTTGSPGVVGMPWTSHNTSMRQEGSHNWMAPGWLKAP